MLQMIKTRKFTPFNSFFCTCSFLRHEKVDHPPTFAQSHTRLVFSVSCISLGNDSILTKIHKGVYKLAAAF